ncbi:MAG: alpha/beta hydrolase [Leeuwenhoekiella sp.]
MKPKNIVFLHYFGGSSESWRLVVEGLPATYNCLPLNIPGFGNNASAKTISIAGICAEIAETLKLRALKNVTLVGHSMGGKLALFLTAKYPELVDRILLVAPSPPTHEPMPEAEKERMLNHPDATEALQTVKNGTVLPLKNIIVETAIKTQLQTDQQTWKWWLNTGMNHSIIDELNDLAIPVHLLTSYDDPVITSTLVQQEIIDRMMIKTHQVLHGVGHLIPYENPQAVIDRIMKIT